MVSLNRGTLLFTEDMTLLSRNRDLDMLKKEAALLLEQAKDWFKDNSSLKINEEKINRCCISLKIGNENEAVMLSSFYLNPKIT